MIYLLFGFAPPTSKIPLMDQGDDVVIKAVCLKVWWLTSDPSGPYECREDVQGPLPIPVLGRRRWRSWAKLSGWSGRLGFRVSKEKSNQELYETSTSGLLHTHVYLHTITHMPPSRVHALTGMHTEGEMAFTDTQDDSFDLHCLPKAPVLRKCSFLPWLCTSGGKLKGWDLMGGLRYWALCASSMIIGWLTTGPENGAKWAQADSETSCLLTF